MRTIAEHLQEKLQRNAFIADGLLQGIINISALARIWKPWLEQQTLEETSEHSISMALRRIVSDHETIRNDLQKQQDAYPVRKILLQTSLIEYVFTPSAALTKVHKELMQMQEQKKRDNIFLHFSQGIRETVFIISESLAGTLESLTKDQERIKKIPNLTAISLLFPDGSELVPGIFYKFLQPLAWESISIVEILSTWSELTFIVQKHDEDQAFTVLKNLAE